jgi:uncharacterized protein GlcG (DUF336 family)
MKSIQFLSVTLAALVLAFSTAYSQQPSDHIEAGIGPGGLAAGQPRPMTVAFAKQLVTAAKKAACEPPAGSCMGAFAVVDDAGVLVYFEIIDGVLAGGPELAIRKAKTSALWRRPTQVFQDAVNNKTNTSYADGTFADMTTSPGGTPVFKDGKVVGGFGVAGVGNGTKQATDAMAAAATKIFGKQ